uniref:Reticulon-like protein n=1 Tax=Panagrellus redivivus TaxID=6233 RepID=A0A7E5A1I2_PANRE
MSESSKSGALGRAFYGLISLIVRLSYKLVLNVALVGSVAITAYTVGEYTHKVIKDKPAVQRQQGHSALDLISISEVDIDEFFEEGGGEGRVDLVQSDRDLTVLPLRAVVVHTSRQRPRETIGTTKRPWPSSSPPTKQASLTLVRANVKENVNVVVVVLIAFFPNCFTPTLSAMDPPPVSGWCCLPSGAFLPLRFLVMLIIMDDHDHVDSDDEPISPVLMVHEP